MSAPVFVGMPPTDRVFTVNPWGRIRCGGLCKDNYARIRHYHHDGQVVTLQQAALASFREAEDACGFPLVVTGSIRSCSQQTALWRSDPARFAPPNITAHCRGLAIDVSQAQAKVKLAKVNRALRARGWHQARPIDEPWHYSFGIDV